MTDPALVIGVTAILMAWFLGMLQVHYYARLKRRVDRLTLEYEDT
jgi:hypothetical protein